MADIIINPDDWQRKTAAQGGLRSSARNSVGEQPANQTVSVRSQLLNDGDPFLAIIEEPPHHFAGVHYHSESEVTGKMLLNGVWCRPGAIIYYAANRHYWHSTGQGRLCHGLAPSRSRLRLDGRPSDRRGADRRNVGLMKRLPYTLEVVEGKTYL